MKARLALVVPTLASRPRLTESVILIDRLRRLTVADILLFQDIRENTPKNLVSWGGTAIVKQPVPPLHLRQLRT